MKTIHILNKIQICVGRKEKKFQIPLFRKTIYISEQHPDICMPVYQQKDRYAFMK